MSKYRDPDYADRQLREAIKIASSGLDLAFLSDAQQNLAEALREQSRVLKDAHYDKRTVTKECPTCKTKVTMQIELSPEGIARSSAHTMKALDMVTRLAEFSRGNPDSRPALQGDWLQGLTEEQLGQVQSWIEANAERLSAEVPELDESEK